eukprot:CAMPEP_0197638386 /NCGR_PEP_ID=MMETSP1338-20131121/13333_1 /TAXON_ID=43686 ORGANISM="Pelagodinium beii, Strain RCC1491" /NCGR_SAMPLE_ID=MMETSP1338 /ASSEMBLY_ACC=CAM_ASM_000754 /LENGTH=502 /DNA_ID=CAMNT_0043210957 /DNA_START=140 /DNA_END=1645 /DNA_ORIENTATION=-
MAGNIPYIGSKISLITTSDIRYEGILFTLNREESTIAVQNVRSFGTEGRRTPEVPMSNEIYDFIIFRGKDLKDLTVLQGAPERQATASTHSPASMGGGSYGGHEYLDSQSHGQVGMGQSPYDSGTGGYSHQSQGSQLTSSGGDMQGLGQRGLHGGTAMGSSAGVGAYQRPSAASVPTRNGYGGNHMGNDVGGGDGYLSSSASRPPASLPPDKNSYGQAPSAHGRQHYSDGPQGHPPAYMPDPGRGAGMYEEGNGTGSSRGLCDEGKGGSLVGGPRPPGATSSAQSAGKSMDGQDRGGGSFGVQGMDGKGATAGSPPGIAGSLADPKGKGRGKAGAQKKPLVEVLRFHKRAEELIVKSMKSQSSASLQPQELRAMSQGNLAVYHFYLDFVNYCCPSSALSDEQQWEGLSKALKKHFEKDFGSGPGQNQKPQQQQRPNNTLADFITIEPSKNGKKGAKVQPGAGGQPSAKPVAPKGKGRGKDKKDDGDFDAPGGYEDSSSGATW